MFDIILLSLYNILNNGGDRMTLGDIIKRYRNDHALSMDAFSERSGISKAYISLLEKNRHPKTGKPMKFQTEPQGSAFLDFVKKL